MPAQRNLGSVRANGKPEALPCSLDGYGGVRHCAVTAGLMLLGAMATSGCAVVTIADAVVDVAATTVKVGAKVVETTVDVTAAGVKAVAGSGDKKQP